MFRPRLRLTAIACVFATALAVVTPTPAADTLERIVAVVNEDVILASELESAMEFARSQMQRNDQRVPPDDVLRERVLERLIMEEIQLQRAERRGISVDDTAVNNSLRNMAERNGTDLAGLRERVEAEGMAFSRLRRDVRRQMIVSRLRQREVGSQVRISPEDVEAALQRMDQANRQRTEFQLRHILIGVDGDASETKVAEARKQAKRLVARLRDGADFTSAAMRASDGPEAMSGGDLGWRPGASLPELFVEAVEDLSVGAVSEPLRSPNGFHILKLTDRRGSAQQTVTEIKARHILLKEEGNGAGRDEPPAREQLAEIRRRLRAGADFANLARAQSDDEASASQGGDLGWVGPGEMTPAFQQVIESLEPGTLSEPFRTPFGWHLVEVLDRREREDVEQYRRAQARRALYERELGEETQRWRQRLRDEAFVDIRTDALGAQ